MQAKIAGLKEQARFAGLTAEQRTELQLADLRMQNMNTLLQLLTKGNMQMPGVVTIDPRIMELYQMPAIAAARQQNIATPYNFFASAAAAAPPRLAMVDESNSASVITVKANTNN
jgi:hypothetical protein